MIHDVTAQRSRPTALAATPGEPPDAPPDGLGVPGPIAWEVAVAGHRADPAPGQAGAAPTAQAEPAPSADADAAVEPAHLAGSLAPAAVVPAVGTGQLERGDLLGRAEEAGRRRELLADAALRPRVFEPWLAPVAEPDQVRVPTEWSLGPVGRRRRVSLLAVASLLTLGLAPALWIGRATREMREFDPRMEARPSRTALALLVAPLVTLLVALAAGGRLVAAHASTTVSLPVGEDVTRWLIAAPLVAPWLCLVVSFSTVAAAMTVERVRVVEDRVGCEPHRQARPVAALGWLLVPGVGLVVLAARVQSRLNRVWRVAVP